MRVLVTRHGRERLLQRLKCRPRKVQKVAEKAWRAPLASSAKVANKYKMHNGETIYKELMGYIFVFSMREGDDEAHLVTMLDNVTTKRAPKKKEFLHLK